MTTKFELEAEIVAAFAAYGEDTISPYKFAGIVEKLLQRDKLNPQMIYRYVKDGRIPSHTNSTGKKELRFTEIFEWTYNFVAKNGTREIESDEEVSAEA